MNSFFYELKRFSIQKYNINEGFSNFLEQLISSDQHNTLFQRNNNVK